MATRLWPDGSALGQRIARRRGGWLTVVGIVDDVVRFQLIEKRDPMFYLPLAQVEAANLLNHVQYVVRTAGSSAGVAREMRNALTRADPGLAAGPIASVDALVLSTVGDRLFQTRMLTAFAVMALVLAAMGVFGMTAQTVSARTREIGIRMALGAKPREVVWPILTGALTLTLIGLAVGGVIALGSARVLAASLYEVTPLDPANLFGVAAILVLTSLLAAYLPARRASRVDPSIVLKGD
jgi:ABC-type antimicrobial peptide transport system permease subunit